jgi:hypothetical protein
LYYQRSDVKAAILSFAKTSIGGAIRECAVYNSKFKGVQRYFGENGSRQPISLDASKFDYILRKGGSAFYCSYWYYDSTDFTNPIGRDLVWIVRAKHGGLRVAKFITRLLLDALREVGVEPWVKYSGDLGFDVIVPLETIPYGAWMGNLETLNEIHLELTEHIVDYMYEHFPEAEIKSLQTSTTIKMGEDICLLSELRVRRGLLLAPMSLNPKTDFASVPINPSRLESFSVMEATPENVKNRDWSPATVTHDFLRFVRFHRSITKVEATPIPA